MHLVLPHFINIPSAAVLRRAMLNDSFGLLKR
jgi:hypothetical protein